ncbi:acetyl-CoA carboxylase biotin carboxyl carrier protein subunit [Ignavigranum ruoffiae]|uniref:acetyl-CoA carboxylase biotin carboxyl carrier protein subunit n=1 Tax=Ignavigranum ruoffiae TaxID=89093 RepID=UPI0024AE3CD0|nr:acetyl-CoA carboxylase biotin carboxyl carrier protein subunit [Ignavigranum ruoffiae]
MLRKFKIKIDGQEYLVEMEEIGDSQPSQPIQTPLPIANEETQAPSTEEKTPAPQTNSVSTSPASADAMKSPMPGKILKILVQAGDQVSENQPVMILEAMKMENEIVAAQAGMVQGIHVNEGQNVNAGDALITIQ